MQAVETLTYQWEVMTMEDFLGWGDEMVIWSKALIFAYLSVKQYYRHRPRIKSTKCTLFCLLGYPSP